MHHIAIMQKSWSMTQKIAGGQKTIESRWYLNRSTPWGKVSTGDAIYFKNSGEPVSMKATVAKVLQFDKLTPAKVRSLLDKYGDQIGLDPNDIPLYYYRFKNKRYCLLIFLKAVQKVRPFSIDKTVYGAMAAWITVPSIKTIRRGSRNSVHLQALKPNGKPHQSWEAQLIGKFGDWIITESAFGTSVRHHTKDLSYIMQHSNLGIFNTKEYYNVFIDFHEDGRFKMLYVNVATPAQLQDGTVSWTDLYLDIVCMPGQKAELVDQDEFDEAKAKGLLTADLADRAEAVATSLMQIVDKGKFPFLVNDRNATTEAITKTIGNSEKT